MMSEKDIIREAVTREWYKLLSFEKYYGFDVIETKIQRIKWGILDELWTTLYDEEY